MSSPRFNEGVRKRTRNPRLALYALALVALLVTGCSNLGGGGKDNGKSVNAAGCSKPSEQGRATKEAVVEEYLAALQGGCEDQIWSLMSEQAELADGDGYIVGRQGLHRLVQAHCGLKLANVDIKYGKNTQYEPQPEMEPETTEYDHGIFVTADFEPSPGPHAKYTEWLSADHTIKRDGGTKTRNWYLALWTVVKESESVRRVPGEPRCFHHELVGQVRDKLVKSKELGYSFVEVIPRDLRATDDEITLKVETWSGDGDSGGQDFRVARFERDGDDWRLDSIERDPDQPGV